MKFLETCSVDIFTGYPEDIARNIQVLADKYPNYRIILSIDTFCVVVEVWGDKKL